MTIFYVVHYNRATRSLDGLDEYADLSSAKRALEAAEVAHLGSGDEVEITLVLDVDLPRILGGDKLPTEPNPPVKEYFIAE